MGGGSGLGVRLWNGRWEWPRSEAREREVGVA